MSIIYSSAEILATFLEQFLLLCIGSAFFENRIKTKLYWFLLPLVSIAYTGLVIYLNSLTLYSYATLSIGIVLFVIALVSFNKCNPIKACCLSVLYMIIISSFDFLFLAFCEYFLGISDFAISVVSGSCPERLITLIVSKGTLILMFLIIKTKKWKVNVSNLTASVLIVMGVVGFFALQYLLSVFFFSDYKEVQKIIFITLAFMVLFFSAILLVLSGQEKMRIKTKENEMVESELRITQERNEQLIETYKEIAKNSHDFKNQMRVTLLMLKNGNISEAQKYLSNVVEVSAESTVKYTGILSVDTVLSEKTRIAAKNGIKLELDVSLSSLCGIDDIDICTILLNLIDNAVEASLKITDESKRYVKIILKNVNSMVFLKVENSFDENSIQPSVEKKNKSMHGYGLKIVNSIAEKNNGSVVTQSEDGRFVATVLI